VKAALQARYDEIKAYEQVLTADEVSALRESEWQAEADALAAIRAVVDELLDLAGLQALAVILRAITPIVAGPKVNTTGLAYTPDPRAVEATNRGEAAGRAYVNLVMDVKNKIEASERAAARAQQIRRDNPRAFGDGA
jgi:hypothetical protein